MKIALFIPNIKSVCGRSKIGSSLLQGLKEKRNEIFLITNPESNLTLLEIDSDHLIIMNCNPEKKSIFKFVLCLLEFKNFISNHNIEIINTHHRYVEFITVVTRFIFRINVKIVTTVHSKTKNHKLFSYKADRLIAVSNFIKNHLISYYSINNAKIELIYNSILAEKISNTVENQSTRYILGVGRFEFEKGFDILINAMKLFSSKISAPKIILVGDGSEKNNLIKSAEINKIDINFNVCVDTPWELIKNSLFVVVSSREESLGLVILEAGMMRKAVIASNTGGIPEIIVHRETGLLFETGDSISLAQLITELIDNKDLAQKLGMNLYQSVINNFSFNKMIDNYINIYKKLLAQ